MDYLSIEEARRTKAAKEQRERDMQNHVGALLDERALAYIAEHFFCNEPAFRPDDNYNHDAAIVRDSYRQVYLTLRRWRRNWKKSQTN